MRDMRIPRSVRSIRLREEMIYIAAALESQSSSHCDEWKRLGQPADETLLTRAEACDRSASAVRFLVQAFDEEAAVACLDKEWKEFPISPAPHG